MFQVIKRDGQIVGFQLDKINEAIRKAFEAKEKQYGDDILGLLGLRVTADFQDKIKDGQITVEDIARAGGGFHYEIVCDIGKRVPRVYLSGGQIVWTKDYFQDTYEDFRS